MRITAIDQKPIPSTWTTAYITFGRSGLEIPLADLEAWSVTIQSSHVLDHDPSDTRQMTVTSIAEGPVTALVQFDRV